jgi:hypothetical protein
MKAKLLLIAALLIAGFSVSAQAQSAFAGRYDIFSGYSSGSLAGLFGYGVASIAHNGAASYSAYYPYLNETGRGTGRINSKGVFSMNNGVRGSATIFNRRVAVGNFSDSGGRGFFAIRKK